MPPSQLSKSVSKNHKNSELTKDYNAFLGKLRGRSKRMFLKTHTSKKRLARRQLTRLLNNVNGEVVVDAQWIAT